MGKFTSALWGVAGRAQSGATRALNGVSSASGQVKNGIASAYGASRIANKMQYGAASLIKGAAMTGSGIGGKAKSGMAAYQALNRGQKTALIGQAGGMIAGAGIGYGSSPEGWGGAGASGGAAAGLFGGAAIARAGSRAFRQQGGFQGMAGSAKSTMSGAYSKMGSAWQNAGQRVGQAGYSAMDRVGKFSTGFKQGFNKTMAGG